MIEPTDEQMEELADAVAGAVADQGGHVWRAEALAAAAAVLAIVARDRCMEARGHTEPGAVEHRLVGDEIRWNPADDCHEAECVCGETFAHWQRSYAEEQMLIHLERESRP